MMGKNGVILLRKDTLRFKILNACILLYTMGGGGIKRFSTPCVHLTFLVLAVTRSGSAGTRAAPGTGRPATGAATGGSAAARAGSGPAGAFAAAARAITRTLLETVACLNGRGESEGKFFGLGLPGLVHEGESHGVHFPMSESFLKRFAQHIRDRLR